MWGATLSVRPRQGITHTVVELELSEAAYKEIREKLLAASYFHCFNTREVDDSGPIDMTGISVVPEVK
jgi:hypothetical protein